ncbi:GNAT family N-acetyltransferase [Halomonas elongata]|uniref:GNAT family N-acetyltransferase n=1 Tax=Halomonas elongata (strain ATCC 33173 / DSM 2581 / NBRC 15536 / NCIMB 2198 / 1H9) TaxID=768066 RepID=A0A1R4A4D2_HALED|nr:GNAT family N-acetyltransferase [Halomonas elongata]WBF16561.1 GNAT family N-acetyltransferase [Halomonas elongata]WPU49002.1 GNAT family N-acetyltransferase [Halomonas elongata DSM 2581]SJK83821.1 GNAT family acetyltransferase [Halomonas elongata DSM 2581]
MEVKIYSEERAKEIADLFHQLVHSIDPSVYSPEQQEVWEPTPPDYERWSQRLKEKKPFIAIIDNRIADFIELDPDGHIDYIYTHPDFLGCGVASVLFEYLLKQAMSLNLERLYVEASCVARPFFENRGFSIIQRDEVKRHGVTLVNFTMERRLHPNNQMQPTADVSAD